MSEDQDTVIFDPSDQGVTIDLSAPSDNAVGPDIGTDQIDGINNLTLGNGPDIVTGNANDNVINAGGGDDVVNGAGGNDTIDGGAGADQLRGGPGFDTLTGGLGTDIFVIEAQDGQTTITDFDFATETLRLVETGFATVNDLLASIVLDSPTQSRLAFTDGTTVILSHAPLPQTPISDMNIQATTSSGNTLPSGDIFIDGTPEQGTELTVDTSFLTDADGLGPLSYQWLRGGSAIPGATNVKYTPVQDDVGSSLSVTVSYNDQGGTDEIVTSGPTAEVDNINDLPTGEVTFTGTLRQGELLTADTSQVQDADGFGLGFANYLWIANNIEILAFGPSNTFTLTQNEVGKEISLDFSYIDLFGQSESVRSAPSASVENVNDAPVGTVPITGTATQGQTLSIDGSGITDPDGVGTLGFSWLRDGSPIIGETSDTYTLTQADVGRTVAGRVTYTDGGGTEEMVTSAPSAQVQNVNDPVQGELKLTGVAQSSQQLSIDTSSLSDADGLGSFTFSWLQDGAVLPGETQSDLVIVPAFNGTKIAGRVTYTDGFGTAEEATTLAVEVGATNSPATGEVRILGSATEGSTLQADTSTIQDTNGLGSFNYQWLRDGFAINGATGVEFIPTQDDVDAEISLSVTFTDLGSFFETFTSVPIGPIGNTNDLPIGALAVSGTATQGETLTADATQITDEDGLGPFTFVWLRGGAVIAGESGTSYTLTEADVTTQITAQVTYTDQEGTFETVTSAATPFIQNVNDTPSGQVTLSGNAVIGETLTADISTVGDADGLGTFSFQWLRDGSDIQAETESSYELTNADLNAEVSVRVTYTDGRGTDETLFSPLSGSVVAANVAPTGTVVITGTTTQGETLSADTSTLADDDGLGPLSYQWVRDGQPISGATSSSYTTVQEDVGKALTVTVSYTDLGGADEDVTSAPTAQIANANDAPTGATQIIGAVLIEGAIITTDLGTLDDPDGFDPLSVDYQWLRNGAEIVGATGDRLTLSQADVGQDISFLTIFTDDEGTVERVESPSRGPVQNFNNPPTALPQITGGATEGATLNALIGTVSDPDGFDPQAVQYQWLRDSQAIANATSADYTLVEADVDARISVQIRFVDGGGTTETLTSPETPLVSPVPRIVIGTANPDTLQGGLGDDNIQGLASDDRLEGRAGDDSVSGGDGRDTAVFSGPQASYTIELSASGITVEDRRGTDGTDTLFSIEELSFLDDDWPLEIFADVTDLTETAFNEFIELYIAYFNRAPDAEGLFFWGNALTNGTSLEQAAALFFDQPETRSTYPDLTDNEAFAKEVYENVLGRTFDQAGLTFWVGVLDSGAVSQANFILEILKGAKAPAEPGSSQSFIDQKAADVAYLVAKTDLGAYFSVHKGMSDVTNAKAVMQTYDGSAASVTAAIAQIDQFYADALSPNQGEFLVQLVGVIDNPFEVI